MFCYFLDEDLVSFSKENEWEINGDYIHIRNQEAHVKSKNISEKITFDSKLPTNVCFLLLNLFYI